MTSAPVRDPLADHLLTPQNAALLLIDYQPAQLAGVHSMAPLKAAARLRRVNWLATRRQPKQSAVLSKSTSISIVRPKPA